MYPVRSPGMASPDVVCLFVRLYVCKLTSITRATATVDDRDEFHNLIIILKVTSHE